MLVLFNSASKNLSYHIILKNRAWQPNPLFLPEKWTEETGRLLSMSPKSPTWLKWLSMHAYTIKIIWKVCKWKLAALLFLSAKIWKLNSHYSRMITCSTIYINTKEYYTVIKRRLCVLVFTEFSFITLGFFFKQCLFS